MDIEITKKIISIANKINGGTTQICVDIPLTRQGFSSVDLIYLLLEIMDEFNVKFQSTDVENYKFNYINLISGMVEEKIKK